MLIPLNPLQPFIAARKFEVIRAARLAQLGEYPPEQLSCILFSIVLARVQQVPSEEKASQLRS
jgi:hypothetical protein